MNLELFEGPLACRFVCAIQEFKLLAFRTRKTAISSIPHTLLFWIEEEAKAFFGPFDAIPLSTVAFEIIKPSK